jgi:hypothetical protein
MQAAGRHCPRRSCRAPSEPSTSRSLSSIHRRDDALTPSGSRLPNPQSPPNPPICDPAVLHRSTALGTRSAREGPLLDKTSLACSSKYQTQRRSRAAALQDACLPQLAARCRARRPRTDRHSDPLSRRDLQVPRSDSRRSATDREGPGGQKRIIPGREARASWPDETPTESSRSIA